MPAADKHYPSSEEIMRQRLMDGCLACLQKRDINKLSIRDIALETGIARQTVYKHFRNKNEILATTFRREGVNFGLQVADYIRDFNAVEDKFVHGFLYVVGNFPKNPILSLVVKPGSTFLADVGMKYFSFAEFGQLVYQQVFDKHPTLARQSEAISELWIRNSLSFIGMPGPERTPEELERFVRERLVPGLQLDKTP